MTSPRLGAHALDLLERLEVGLADRRAQLEPAARCGLARQQGGVVQHAAGDDAVAERVDAALGTAAGRLDFLERRAGVTASVHEDVAVDGVEVAVDDAVVAAAVLQPVRPARLADADDLAVQDRRRVDRLLLHDVVRQRDADALLDEGRGLLALRGRDEVRGAELVVGAPATLVGQLLQGPLDVGQRLHALVLLALDRDARQRHRARRRYDRQSGSLPRHAGPPGFTCHQACRVSAWARDDFSPRRGGGLAGTAAVAPAPGARSAGCARA